MKIGVTYEDGKIFQHFGRSQAFKCYTVEDGHVVHAEVVSTGSAGHAALANFLKDQGVDTVICGHIGGGAKAALAAAGIALYGGVAGKADAAVDTFLSGALTYDPDVQCDHPDPNHTCPPIH